MKTCTCLNLNKFIELTFCVKRGTVLFLPREKIVAYSEDFMETSKADICSDAENNLNSYLAFFKIDESKCMIFGNNSCRVPNYLKVLVSCQ